MNRRDYQRILINTEGVFIVQNKEISPREFLGTIEDISESGIKIVTNKADSASTISQLESGDALFFQSVDSFDLLGTETDTVFSGTATITRIEDHPDSFHIGCKFKKPNNDLEKYVSNRKLSLFIDSLKNN